MAIVKTRLFFSTPPDRQSGDICIDTSDGDVDIFQVAIEPDDPVQVAVISLQTPQDAADLIAALQEAKAKRWPDGEKTDAEDAFAVTDYGWTASKSHANRAAKEASESTDIDEQPTEAARSES